MTPTLLFRIASGLLFFFGATHTYGLFQDPEPAAKELVVTAMRTVHFEAMGSRRSLWEFYTGFGMLFTVFLLFSAFLAWQLGEMVKEHRTWARNLAWPFAVTQTAVAVLCWTNFFLAPQIVSTVVAVCLLAAAWQASRS